LNFLDGFSKSTQTKNFMKIRPVGAELFNATDGRTDMRQLTVTFRNFVNVSKQRKVKCALVQAVRPIGGVEV